MGRLFIHQILVLLLEIRQLLAFPLIETRHQLIDQRSQRVVRFQIQFADFLASAGLAIRTIDRSQQMFQYATAAICWGITNGTI